jgi:hypothetical protein
MCQRAPRWTWIFAPSGGLAPQAYKYHRNIMSFDKSIFIWVAPLSGVYSIRHVNLYKTQSIPKKN